jgi:hypothetical protein
MTVPPGSAEDAPAHGEHADLQLLGAARGRDEKRPQEQQLA